MKRVLRKVFPDIVDCISCLLCVTQYPQTQLKQQIFIISKFLWVRNPGANQLGPPAQGYREAAVEVLTRAIISRLSQGRICFHIHTHSLGGIQFLTGCCSEAASIPCYVPVPCLATGLLMTWHGRKRASKRQVLSFKPNLAIFSLAEASHQIQLTYQDVNTRRQGSLGAVLDAAYHIDKIPLLYAPRDQDNSLGRTSMIAILHEQKHGVRGSNRLWPPSYCSHLFDFSLMAVQSLNYERHEDQCHILLISVTLPIPQPSRYSISRTSQS